MSAIDLDMLAADFAKMLDRYDYPIDAPESAIRAALPAFVGQVLTNALAVPDEPSEDAATWTPQSEPAPEPAVYQPPRYGRVRVFPIYVFAATDPTDPDIDEIWITDYDKAGEQVARQQATAEAAKVGGTVGRLLRKETFRWRPYAGTPRGARP